MSTTSGCGCTPCTTQIATQREPLASTMDNLIEELLGTLTKTYTDGRWVWTLPCDLAYDGITGTPRADGEGLLCYILRLLQTIDPEAAPSTTVVEDGSEDIAADATYQDIVFAVAKSGTTYVFDYLFIETTDDPPGSFAPGPVSQKTVNGCRVNFYGAALSANCKLKWKVRVI